MNLNPEQKYAVDCNDSKIVCLSGAGTGKTTVMIARISRLISEGVDPRDILALTFTNVAAFEMKERFKKQHPNSEIPEFRTFHSFCYNLLCRNEEVRKALNYSTIPAIAPPSSQNRVTTTAALQMNLKLSKAKLSGKVPMTPKEQYQYDRYNAAMRRLLFSENMITFDVLCYDICKLFKENHPCVDEYKKRFKYIFVDEFQDTDIRQWEFVQSFQDSNLFVVGDALQAVYAFRGANSDIIKQLSEDKDWTAIKLAQNYRSTQQICDFANDMSTYADDSYRVALQAVRSGDSVQVWPSEAVPYSEPICENNIHDMMNELKCIEESRSIAILCRTNNEVDRICQELSRSNLEFSKVKATSEVNELLNSCTDSIYLADWLSTYLVAELYSEYIRTRESHKSDSPLKILIDMYGAMPQISYRFKTVMMLRKTLQAAYEDKVQKLSDICKLLDIEVPDIDISGMTGKEVIEALKESLQNPSGSSIYVGTIHSVKGLEFDDVYLIGVNDISFKLKNEENNNLYYVGITRARNHLTVCYRKEEYPYDSARRNRAITKKHSFKTV